MMDKMVSWFLWFRFILVCLKNTKKCIVWYWIVQSKDILFSAISYDIMVIANTMLWHCVKWFLPSYSLSTAEYEEKHWREYVNLNNVRYYTNFRFVFWLLWLLVRIYICNKGKIYRDVQAVMKKKALHITSNFTLAEISRCPLSFRPQINNGFYINIAFHFILLASNFWLSANINQQTFRNKKENHYTWKFSKG